jgi:NTE family protein
MNIGAAAAIALLCATQCARAQEPNPVGARPRICLVLSGGGARGLAHVGVLSALEARKIPIDCVVGTSMGAIVGGLYAAGYSPAELDTVVRSMDWSAMLRDTPERKQMPFRRKIDDLTYLTRWEFGVTKDGFTTPPGLVAGHRIGAKLRLLALRASGTTDFDQLPLPFRAVATDVDSGRALVLDRGDLGVALRASAAIPGLFAPVNMNGQMLVDGGLVDNLPITVAKSLRADVIIAVDLGEPLAKRARPTSMISTLTDSASLLSRREAERSLADANVVIAPAVRDYGILDFDAVEDLIERGEQAVAAQDAALQQFTVADTTWQRHVAGQRRALRPMTIGTVTVTIANDRADEASSIAPAAMEDLLQLKTGEVVEADRLSDDLNRVWERGAFESVDFKLVPTESTAAPPGSYDLHLQARRKSWGPNYLRFGFTLASDLEGSSSFNLLSALTMTELNSLNGEFKLTAQIGDVSLLAGEWYQPLSSNGIPFAALSVAGGRNKIQVMEGTDLVQQRYVTVGGDADIGVSFGRFGEIRTGVHYVTIDGQRQSSGRAPIPSRVDAGFRTRLIYDQMDRINFPRSGIVLSAEYYESSTSLQSDEPYRRASVSIVSAATLGRHTAIGLVDGVSGLGDELPIDAQLRLGGLFHLSGLPAGELSGSYGGKASAIYLYRLGRLPNFVDGIYIGASAETGNVWQRSEDVDFHNLRKSYSLLFGIDTYVGPVYFAHGRTSGGKDSLYLYLGRSF